MPAFFLGGDPLVLTLSGSVDVFANGNHALRESRRAHHFLGVGKTRTGEKPGRVFAVASPCGVGSLDVVGDLEFLALFAKPGCQLIPLAQQAFQSDLDHDLAVTTVLQ